MSAFADERLALSITQHALLWGIRLWVAEPGGTAATLRRMGYVLGRLGAPEAAVHLGGFMTAIGGGPTRPLGMNYLCQAVISADEHALLDILALAQDARAFEALLLLRSVATRAAAQMALRHATHTGTALAGAGRRLPAPTPAIRQLALGPAVWDRGHPPTALAAKRA